MRKRPKQDVILAEPTETDKTVALACVLRHDGLDRAAVSATLQWDLCTVFAMHADSSRETLAGMLYAWSANEEAHGETVLH